LRRPPRPRRRVVPALVPLATAAVAALAAFVFLRTPGSHVQARAARAADATFFVVEDVQARRPGLFPATSVSGYVDGGRGRAHVRIFLRSAVAETVLHEDGSVERWLASSDTTTFAPSCDLLPGGCGEVLDPFSFYVRALEGGGARVRRAGGQCLLTLGGGRVEQVAHVDARTYLPRLIEWRQDGRVVAVVRLTSLERQHGGLSPDAWTMSDHGGARVVQLTAAGRPVRVLGARPAARSAGRRWLGPSFGGAAARVERVALTGGSAVRIAYGEDVVVWNYGRVVPPPVLQARSLPAKVFTAPGGAVVHAYFGRAGTQVAVVAFADGNAAVVSRTGANDLVLRAAQLLRRPGSP